jgi:hypothetical protein
VLLTGDEDPPVIVECLEENAQILACEQLSDFIFACAWDLSLKDRPFAILMARTERNLCKWFEKYVFTP